MTHNGSAAEASRLVLARRVGAALVGLLLYIHGLQAYLPGGTATQAPAGLGGAFLLAGATYAIVASLGIQGTHRRPNAEVGLVGSLFTLLVLLQVAVTPSLAGTLPVEAVVGLAAATLAILLVCAAYVARPALFRDPP